MCTSSKASAYFLLWVCLNPANCVLRDNDVACACASTTTKAAQNRNFMLTILLPVTWTSRNKVKRCTDLYHFIGYGLYISDKHYLDHYWQKDTSRIHVCFTLFIFNDNTYLIRMPFNKKYISLGSTVSDM